MGVKRARAGMVEGMAKGSREGGLFFLFWTTFCLGVEVSSMTHHFAAWTIAAG